MGSATSSFARAENLSALFASPREKAAFERIVSELPVPREDGAYSALLNAPTPLTHLSRREVEYLNQEYGTTLAQNNLKSGNFRVLVRLAIHLLPLCCRMEKMTPDELESYAPPTANALTENGGDVKKRSTLESHIQQAANALFLVRNFTMRFVEKQDECSLLAHFNQVSLPDFNAVVSPRNRGNTGIRVGESTLSAPRTTGVPPPLARQTSSMSDDLAFRFLETLMTVLIDFPPTPKTYEVHAEVLNTLLVLLSPVAFPRDHSKNADDLSAHNPFLHMLMSSSLPGAKKDYWASGLVRRLLFNYMEPLASPPTAKDSLSVNIATKNAEETSLIKISENLEASAVEDAEQFSYLTLEGIGSLASTIFKFPLSFYHYFVAPDGYAYPIADRSALLLLILMQSCRDTGAPVNPFRDVLCSVVNSEKASAANDEVKTIDAAVRRDVLKVSFTKLFASVGHKAPYESSHLLLYTLLYTNPIMHDAAISNCDVNNVMLPLLETLYHAKSVDPSRIYMLVIVLLTFTQDPAFVRDAHTKMMVHKVPWYSERYILDVSLGSLMMVIFTRLIYRNITHFQDSFIHLNAFAALSNLARYAENIHVYAAQNIVVLIEMLAKMEAKFSAKMERAGQLENEELVQKRNAYVEFIRLLLGVISSCLKPNLLPRNPQLIYSLLYRAETFTTLQRHPEFAHQVNNYSVWSTLSRFQTHVESKTNPEETLDVHIVLELITAECVSMLASSAASTSRAAGTRAGNGEVADDEASYRYEEEVDPEQFFIPYIWKLVFEQTPEFCWKVDKITLFTPSKTTITTE